MAAIVKSLRPRLDPVTRTQNMILQIKTGFEPGIVPGQIVRLPLPERISAKGFLLPASALTPGPRGLWKVFVVGADMLVEQRDVEVLYALGKLSLVSGTLSSGDAVVIDGVHRVVAGQEVSVASELNSEES